VARLMEALVMGNPWCGLSSWVGSDTIDYAGKTSLEEWLWFCKA
jgi:hypothetical protein